MLQSVPVRLVLGIVFVVGAMLLFQTLLRALSLPASRAAEAAKAALAAAAAVGAYVAFVRLVERRAVVELGTRAAAREFGSGFFCGVALFCVTIAILCLLGVCRVVDGDGWRALPGMLALALAAGFGEEILVRGVVFRIVEEALGSWIALAISAALFGLLHAANPGASVTSTLAIALEPGVLLAAAFIYTRRLWMAIGLHVAWNFTEGGIFGAAISGHAPRGLVHSELVGSTVLTGGAFGPEASLVAVVLCFAAGVSLLVLARRRGHIVAPRWRRRALPPG